MKMAPEGSMINLVNGNDKFCRLVLDVSSGRRYTKWMWFKSPLREDVHLGEIGEDAIDETYVVNEMGVATVMPCYLSYAKTFKEAMWVNPFEVDWLNYTKDDPVTSNYLDHTILILEEQMLFWQVDGPTRNSLLYVTFGEFVDSLRALQLA